MNIQVSKYKNFKSLKSVNCDKLTREFGHMHDSGNEEARNILIVVRQVTQLKPHWMTTL